MGKCYENKPRQDNEPRGGNSASLEREAGNSEETLSYKLKPHEDFERSGERRQPASAEA